MKSNLTIVVFVLIFISGLAFAQNLAESVWMEAFNAGDFEKVVAEMPAWLEPVEWDLQGIPLYFLAESYYNLALAETNVQRARTHLQAALKNFEDCLKHADLNVSEYKNTALYKKAWSNYRLAELGGSEPEKLFQKAFEDFSQIDKQANDNLALYGTYMAGDAKLRQAVLARYTAFSKTLVPAEVNSIFALLAEAADKFKAVLNQQHALDDLKIAARIRLKDIDYQKAKIYQNVTTDIFQSLNDPNKGASSASSTQQYLNNANYLADVSLLPATKKETVESALLYSDAITALEQYLTAPESQRSLTFTSKIDNVPDDPYAAEKNFRKGNRDQANEILNEGPFLQLTLDNSLYARAAGEIPEASYWHGFVKSVLVSDRALPELNAYLERVGTSSLSYRQQVFKEDAELRKLSLDLERIMKIPNAAQKGQQLSALEQDVEKFRPTIARIQANKEQVMQRIGIAKEINKGGNQNDIAGRIYSNILRQNQALAEQLIQELLPQAASATGLTGESYLRVLDVLCLITSSTYPNESNFYKGIVLSLKAEINSNQTERANLFRESASVLAQVTGQYRDEARYIQARSLFFAREYDDATEILTDLINRKNSLRALFYLGESFRMSGNGNAARRCYQVIRQQTQNADGGTFWFNNAGAAGNTANTQGNDNALRGINIESVRFPDVLLVGDDGQAITYEGLADSRFLQSLLANQAKELLMKFGLPKRTIYPSPNQLVKSQIVSEGIFPELFPIPDERRGAITATLRLMLVTADGSDLGGFRVSLDGEIMPSTADGVYIKEQIDLNDSVSVRIDRSGYYSFIEMHTFKSPGVDSLFVVPTKTLKFTSQGKGRQKDAVVLDGRLDGNMILNTVGDALPSSSNLYQDLNSNSSLRDYVFHPILNTYLVVDAANNRIVRAPTADTQINLASPFTLTFGGKADALNSPEGIAVDSDGNVYIADWGNHRVLVFDMSGSLTKTIGAFGVNPKPGDHPVFQFPTRISVAENTKGISYNGKTVFADKLIFVADRNGVHVIDERGFYLDKILSTSDSKFSAGSFYGIRAEGYGKSMKLKLVERSEDNIQVYEAN